MSGASNPPTSSGDDFGPTGFRLKHCLREVLEVRSIFLSVFLFQFQIFYVCLIIAYYPSIYVSKLFDSILKWNML
jgi:hypothetical protein